MGDDRPASAPGIGEAALDRALEDKDLLLLYQPIHDLNGVVVAAEALLRQRRQSGEIREASIITETAEEAAGPELFVLDSWVVRTAYRDAGSWQRRHPNVRLNVNLSPREFTDERMDIVGKLKSVIGESNTDPRRVSLEITETRYIERPRETVDVLNQVRSLGFELWLDDFGTRFSSMTHVQHFPLDGLKIAGTFVSGLPDDKRCRAICKALLSLARDLELRVIAEEVENEAQLDVLRELGGHYIQGFLYSRPMPLEEFQKFLDAGEPASTPQERRDRDADRGRASRSS